jgi:heterodisulfide reductase subunit A
MFYSDDPRDELITMAADEGAKVGVYLCECGGNIGDVVDVEEIRKHVGEWDSVAVARKDNYLCSKPAQDIILADIERHGLDRVVVASCTPRMHLPTFQGVLERAGLNPYLLEFSNIREQCSWVHGPHASEEATRKAESIVRGGYERSLTLEPLEEICEKASGEVLVIGGGIAGITASLELEEQGHTVHLVEREPSIGGHMARLTKVFPTLDCAQCILTPRIAEVGRREGINLLSYSEVESLSGRPGNYSVTVRRKPRGVDLELCTGCSVCSRVCPVKVPDEFNEGRSERVAAYLQFPQAVPYVYAIDFDHCTKCSLCVEKCPNNAINLDDEGSSEAFNVGSIVVATGYQQFPAADLAEYGYGVYPDVVTMLEMERQTSLFGPTKGMVTRFSDGEEAKKIAMVLCAGSRDKSRYTPYCSRICCMYSIKQAIMLREMLGKEVWVYYTDIRATGRGYEELYWRAQEAGVNFIRGKASEVWKNSGTGRLVVRAEDTLTGNVMEEEFDMVALAVAMIPSEGLEELAQTVSLPLGADGFVQEKHPKLDPVETLKTGIFACGCALGPKDVRDTVSDSLGAVAKTVSFLGEGVVSASPEKAYVDPETCDGCGDCVPVCPVDAITLINEKAEIEPFTCNGCGGCVPACPRETIDFKNSTRAQLRAALRGVMKDKEEGELRLVAFVEKSIGYTGVDFLGLDRGTYPESVRVIPVPTTALLDIGHILDAFDAGADGIIAIEGNHDVDEAFTRERMDEYREELEDIGVDGMRLYYSLVQLPAYKNIARLFEIHVSTVEDLGPLEPEELEAVKGRLEF